MNWSDYPNFSKREFDCKETGLNDMQPEFMRKLQELRDLYGKPMKITSGYRSKFHSAEVKKQQGGTHTLGIACDVSVSGSDAYKVIQLAMSLGFTGVGVAKTFVHLDIAQSDSRFHRPTIWIY